MSAHPLELRAIATRATLARFKDQPVIWGRNDCARLSAFQLKGLGYKISLARFGPYSTEAGGRRALERAGYADMGEALDDLGLRRLGTKRNPGYASAHTGDLIGMPGLEGAIAIGVLLGNGRALCFLEGVGCRVVKPLKIVAAWSCPPQFSR